MSDDEDYDEEEPEMKKNAWRITLAGVNDAIHSKKTPTVVLDVLYANKETKITCVPDTGAEKTVIGLEEAKRIGANLNNLVPCRQKLYAADRKRLTCLGMIPVSLKLGERTSEVELVVISEVHGFLLSWYHAIELGILHESFPDQIKQVDEIEAEEHPIICTEKNPSAEIKQEHKKLLQKTFKSVFETEKELKPMFGKPMRILLTEDAVPFNLTSPRSIPFAWREQCKLQVEEMVQKGIIKKVNEPTDWCHPMVPVAKKNSTEVRLCVDLTRLNKYVRRGAHPVVTAHDAVSGIKPGSNTFTLLDAKTGYWQIPIAEEDQDLTCFITPWGRYKFLRAPMGLTVSGDEYNRRGDEALEEVTNTVKVVDDVLVYDEDYQQHLNNVTKVLRRCKTHSITLNPKKFMFSEPEVEFCGYKLNENGFSPNEDKLSAITKFKSPSNITELRSFLGLANQLSQFSTEVSQKAEPLRQLLKKNNEWIWSDCHEKAFNEVKSALAKPPILAYYDPELPTVLETDAAKLKGLGFACLQQHKDKSWKLVDCGSRFLSSTESRYATIELEMLAIVWALKKCRRYLAGRPHFEVITDHKPLIPIINSKGLNEIENPRLQRLKEKTTEYNFTVRWRKGNDHSIPDALSRSPADKADEEDELAEEEIEELMHATIISNIYLINEDREYQDRLLEEIHRYSKEDPEYQLLMKTITDGFPENNHDLPPQIRSYSPMKDLLCIDDGLIVCGQRVLIPKILRKEVLQSLHKSHQGIEKTKRRARQLVYWPGINNDVENAVQSCEKCQQLLPSLQKEPMMTEDEPTRPFQVTSTDYFDHAGKQYLIYADRHSGWPIVQMYTRGATALKLITTLRNVFAATGVPEVLRSDNGPQFKAKVFQQFLKEWKVKHVTSSPHYPQSNGHAESAVKAVKYLIIKSTVNGNLDTDQFAMGLLELRNSPRQDGRSPAQVLFGHPIRSILPIHRRAYESQWQQSKDQYKEKREEIKKFAEQKYNMHAKILPEFRAGTNVNVQDERTGRWTVTGIIVEVGRNRQYLIKKRNGQLIWRNRKFIRRHHPISPAPNPLSINQPVNENFHEEQEPEVPYQHQNLPDNSTKQRPTTPPKDPLTEKHSSKSNNNKNKMPITLAQESTPTRVIQRRKRFPPIRLTLDPKLKRYQQK